MDRYMISIPAVGPCKLAACDDGDSIKLETMQELVSGHNVGARAGGWH